MATPHEGVPTHWLNYLTVENLDASLAQSTTLGGVTLFGPMHVPTVGMIATLQDPQGAVFGLLQPE